jgi:hypothetical protein
MNNARKTKFRCVMGLTLLKTELQKIQMPDPSLVLVTHTHRQPAHAPASRVMVAMAQHCSVMVAMVSLAETAATPDSSVMAEQVVSAQQAQPELSALVQFFPSVTAPTQVQVGMAVTAVVAVRSWATAETVALAVQVATAATGLTASTVLTLI